MYSASCSSDSRAGPSGSSLTNVRATQKEYAIKIRNVWSFFCIYATIDGFDPARNNPDAKGVSPSDLAKSEGYRPAKERSLLDRWMLSELALATRDVIGHLDGYRLYEGAQRLVELVDALSNWYVRRSRSRFWSPVEDASAEATQDKCDAYFTLYEALVTIDDEPRITEWTESTYSEVLTMLSANPRQAGLVLIGVDGRFS